MPDLPTDALELARSALRVFLSHTNLPTAELWFTTDDGERWVMHMTSNGTTHLRFEGNVLPHA